MLLADVTLVKWRVPLVAECIYRENVPSSLIHNRSSSVSQEDELSNGEEMSRYANSYILAESEKQK
jgi:hypothetical protein